MATTSTKSNRVKLMAGVAVVAGSMAGLIGSAAVANADPVVILNGEEIEPPSLVSPWPGGAWAGWDWSKGWPGGAWAGHDWSKGWPGGGYANGKAGGAWNHTAE
ncbi:hypothetical protein [Mycolicibacterium neworleansense]|uniref:Uncharacterized protein n=1 Tax=Mycolicibacterium neworleansense TaxID=146018 RepID=A0A0H5RW36_9MYCO|nr:hypothetical protein [Mycolicibacterium neworleansense]MCV7361178.1 hypothetical protein [Mycolicibacterium neworleansense]CRZ18325.1 hypothetical protein BN2156_05226 [Mycolicibacterium neworleansense]